jgi:hypothetical protein
VDDQPQQQGMLLRLFLFPESRIPAEAGLFPTEKQDFVVS